MDSHSTYELLEEIGRGEAATVYRGYDSQLKRYVAIKALRDKLRRDPRQMEHFWEEAQFLANLEHDNVVKVYGIDKERGWIVMELMRGSLDTKLADGPLSHDLVRSILRQTLEGLKFLHSKGKLHGAIKPANLLINDEGRIRLSDSAGIVVGREVRKPTGSHKYLAPELLNPVFGEVTPAVNLYCLGFTALELLQGGQFNELFAGVGAGAIDPELGWMRWHGSSSERLPLARLVAGLPPDLARVIERSLEKDVAKRYANADEALNDLKNLPLLAVDLPGEPKKRPIVETHGAKAPPPPPPIKKEARKAMKPTPSPGDGPPAWSKDWINQKLQDKRILTAVCALIVLPLLAVLFRPEATESPEFSIATRPKGATVAIDGKEKKNHTDFAFHLTPGRHKVRLSLPGYKPVDREITVGEEKELSVDLERDTRKVTIASVPPGAAVIVDEQDKGKKTDAELELPPGKHSVRLELAGYRPLDDSIDVDKDGQRFPFRLAPKGGQAETKPGGAAGRRQAVLVAERDEGYPFADADVDELAEILARAGYERADMVVLKNPSASEAMERLRGVASRLTTADTLLVVFAGREPAPLGEAYRELAAAPALQKVLVADVPESDPVPAGLAVLFSRARGQRRYRHFNWRHSVFMHAVIQGLGGQADLDRGGQVTADELGGYVAKSVAAYLRQEYPQQPVQTPVPAGSGPSTAVLSLVPSDGTLMHYSRGSRDLEAGDFKAAVDDFSRAIGRDGTFAQAHLGRAVASFLQAQGAAGKERCAEALADCRAAIDLDRRNADAFALRGEVYHDLGQDQEAMADLANVINNLAPDWASAYQTRARVYRDKKEYAAAVNDLDKAIALEPLNYVLFAERGATRYQMKDDPGAEGDFRKAIALNPNWYPPYRDLSQLCKRRGDEAGEQQWLKEGQKAKAGLPSTGGTISGP